MQHVFEGIDLLKDYEGDVMLLEDDYYLSEDIIFTTHMLRGLKERFGQQILVLLFSNKRRIYYVLNSRVALNVSIWPKQKCSNIKRKK